jgi:hypothetical protein
MKVCTVWATMLALLLAVLAVGVVSGVEEPPKPESTEGKPAAAEEIKIRPIAPFVQKGLGWLVEAQHANGGWGGGSHANQQNKDVRNIQTDPATTAFAALALLRAGHTPVSGDYKASVRKATEHLVHVVETSETAGPKITAITGTQPQAKLGPLVDTSMTAQFLARVLPTLPEGEPLRSRVNTALERCLAKLQVSQQKDGSWNIEGGWAPVLQSSLGCSALELAQVAGKKVDGEQLERARDYQKGNFDRKTGRVDATKGAGVALYAFSGAQRANAGQARAAQDALEQGKREGKLAQDAPVNRENLEKAGVAPQAAAKLAEAKTAIDVQNRQLNDESLLAGFGSNGGEEFLSYLMSCESLVITGGKQFSEFTDKMHERLAKVQNPDGSWSGHHCITSSVFCTAAVIQCLTTDRDAKVLIQIAGNAAKARGAATK